MHTSSDLRETGYPIVLDSIEQRHDHDPGKRINILNANPEVKDTKLTHPFAGKSSGFTFSEASTWADEELTKRKPEVADATNATALHILNTAKNNREKKKIAAGKERGDKVIQAFDDAWANARNNS